MTPSTQLRLQTMLRALAESITPAIDPTDSLALEQAGLLQGHIQALLEQQGQEHRIDQKEFDALRELAKFLLSVAAGGTAFTQAKSNLEQALDGDDAIALSLATERLLSAPDASQAFKQASWTPVLQYARDTAARGQQWFKPMGF
ncbi:MAG: hypothetical protein GYB33_21940 [Gammaproteobacteria bacterium]|nr:hypothetical protein [Gammaproteobacteria bacterium]